MTNAHTDCHTSVVGAILRPQGLDTVQSSWQRAEQRRTKKNADVIPHNFVHKNK